MKVSIVELLVYYDLHLLYYNKLFACLVTLQLQLQLKYTNEIKIKQFLLFALLLTYLISSIKIKLLLLKY